jgi:hypothetical protein
VEKSASPPHLFSVRNPHLLLLLPVFSTSSKPVISTEAAHGLLVSRAVEEFAAAPAPLQIRLFLLIAAFT